MPAHGRVATCLPMPYLWGVFRGKSERRSSRVGASCIGSLIEEWERKKREELQKRREESARKKSVSMEAGQKALTDFDSKRKTEVERAQAKNRTDEKDTMASMEVRLRHLDEEVEVLD